MSKSYFMYLRRSQDREDKQTESIERQEHELRELVDRLQLRLAGEPIRESRTAKKPGRPLFDKMMADLARGRADGIVCWHLSRLARNALDGGRVMQALADRTLEEIVIPGRTFTGTGDDRLLMAVEFGMATKTSDDLAKFAKDGAKNLLRKGLWPTRPKLGYVRAARAKELLPDPERFEMMQKAWVLKLRGVSVAEIERLADEWGLRTPESNRMGGGRFARSQWYRIFRDPFYCGLMPYDGMTYEGTHEPMVSRGQFAAIQSQFGGPLLSEPRPKLHSFAYRGLLRCGACGGMITGEQTTNRHGSTYIYYRCTRRTLRYTDRCSQPAIENRALEAQIVAFLEAITVPEPVARAVLGELESRLTGEVASRKTRDAQLASRISRIDTTLGNLRRMCAAGVITSAELEQDRAALLLEREQAIEERCGIEQPEAILQPLKEAFSFANTAVRVFKNGSDEAKRDILRSTVSNPVLCDRKLAIQAQKPFDLFMRDRTVSGLVNQLARCSIPFHSSDTGLSDSAATLIELA